LFVHCVQFTAGHNHFAQRLATLPNIEKVVVPFVTELAEFEHLSRLQKLQELFLSGPPPRPLLYNVVEKMTSLRALKMTYFPNDFDRIVDNCIQLTKLVIRSSRNDANTQITSIQKLTHLRVLKLVIAPNIPPVEFDGLVQLVHLTELVLFGALFSTNVTRGDLNALTNLRALKLTQMRIDNFSECFEKLTKLERLVVHQRKTSHAVSIFEECLVLPKLTSLEVDSLTTKGNYHRMDELTQLKALQVDVSHNIKH